MRKLEQGEELAEGSLKPHKAPIKEAVDAMMKKILAERAAKAEAASEEPPKEEPAPREKEPPKEEPAKQVVEAVAAAAEKAAEATDAKMEEAAPTTEEAEAEEEDEEEDEAVSQASSVHARSQPCLPPLPWTLGWLDPSLSFPGAHPSKEEAAAQGHR